ncbi:disulfide oxidoreductase [Patescibacteria group bacterium]|nr:disulfide oxidoreductase [Patescibacteria group bacterium]
MKFNKNTKLGEIIKSSKGNEVLHRNGVPCVTCPMAQFELETLEIGQICEMYGLDLEKILKELNE